MKNMKGISTLMAIAALTCGVWFNTDAADPFKDNMAAAQKAEQQKDYAKAVELVTLAEKSAANDNAKTDCITKRYSLFMAQGDLNKAKNELDKLQSVKCDNIRKFGVFFNFAGAMDRSGDFANALKYAALAESFTDNPIQKCDCRCFCFDIYLKQKNEAKAIATLNTLFNAEGANLQRTKNAASKLVKILLENKKNAEAKKIVDALEKVTDPKNEIAASVSFLRMDIAKANGDVKTLEAEFDNIMKKKCSDNDKFNYAKTLTDYFLQTKNYDTCIVFCNRAVKVLPEEKTGSILRAQANAYQKLKKAEDEEKILLQIVSNEKYDWNVRMDAASRLCKAFYNTADKRKTGLEVIAKMKSAKVNPARLALEAEYLFEQGDDAGALAIFDNALKTPGLTDAEKSQIFFEKAKILKMQTRFVDAARAYQTSANLCKGTNYWALRGMVDCFIKENHINEALQNMEYMSLNFAGQNVTAKAKAYIDLINTAVSVGDFTRAKKYTARLIALGNLPPYILPEVQYMPFYVALAGNDLPQAEAEMNRLIAMKHRRAGEAAFLLGNIYFERAQLKKAVQCFAHLPGTTWPQTWQNIQNVLTAFVLANQEKTMKSLAMELAEQGKLPEKDKAVCRMVGTDRAFSARELKLSDSDYAESLAKAAKLYVRFGNEQKAREFFAQRAKLFNPAKRNLLNIRYVKNAPTDVGAWQGSPLLKDKRNRADVTCIFGAKEAAFLITDVMAAGRKVGDASIQADKETYFYMCYDEYGIHLYFVGVDSKVKDVLANRIGGSGYEMYLALGETGPSYQWLFEQPKDKLEIPPWSSPNKYYRRLDDYITISSRPVDGGIATAMNFSWELAYDRLPANGDTWPFELIRWTRGGGVTWGGKFVWEIGRWGRIKFEGLTPDVLDKIRAIIIYKALARYNAQRQPRTGGKIAIWQDAELGDPQFYSAALKAEVERLDELAKLVTNNMDHATIEKLWVEAVPYWFDFIYRAAELRKDYLQKRFIETGK